MILYDQKPMLGQLPVWAPNMANIPVPVGAYLLNERTGETATDLSGNGNHGAVRDVSWNTGKYGYQVPSDSSSGSSIPRINCGKNFFLGGDYSVVTISKTRDSSVASRLWSQEKNVYDIQPEIQLRKGVGENRLNFYLNGAIVENSASYVFEDNTWYHTVSTIENGVEVIVYFDGVEYWSHNIGAYTTNTQTANYSDFGIGYQPRWEGVHGYGGYCDSAYCLVFDCVLTPSQAMYLYQHPYYAWEYPEIWKLYVTAAAGGVSPTGNIYGPLYGPFSGVI